MDARPDQITMHCADGRSLTLSVAPDGYVIVRGSAHTDADAATAYQAAPEWWRMAAEAIRAEVVAAEAMDLEAGTDRWEVPGALRGRLGDTSDAERELLLRIADREGWSWAHDAIRIVRVPASEVREEREREALGDDR